MKDRFRSTRDLRSGLDLSDKLTIGDSQLAERVRKVQEAVLTLPRDPSTERVDPATVPFYRRRWFWALAGVGTFALIYRQQQD